jgi:hypothetical protein
LRHLELRYRALRQLYRHNQVPFCRGMHIAWSAERVAQGATSSRECWVGDDQHPSPEEPPLGIAPHSLKPVATLPITSLATSPRGTRTTYNDIYRC